MSKLYPCVNCTEDVFYEPWCPDDVAYVLGDGRQLTDKDCGKCALKWLKQEAQ